MVDKNLIEEFFSLKKKQITGKGPRNIVVSFEEDKLKVIVYGFLTHFEKETLITFPDAKGSVIKSRLAVFNMYFESYKKEAEMLIGREITGADIRYMIEEDQAIIIYQLK